MKRWGITCYLQDEDVCDDPMCLRKGCKLESSSAVERLAVNEDVAGSKPASPANLNLPQDQREI